MFGASGEEYEGMRGHGQLRRRPILAAAIAGIVLQGAALAQHLHTTTPEPCSGLRVRPTV